MRTRTETLAWWHSDSGVLPDAHPTKPWTKRGAQVPTLADDGVDIDDAIGEVLTYSRLLEPTDTRTSGARSSDSVDMQIGFRGISEAAGWAGGASPQGLYVDDGTHKLAVGIGSSLDLMNPDTGAIVETISDSWPWLSSKTYLLRKVGTVRWELWVDGKRLAVLGYERSPISTTRPAEAGFGSLDGAGTSEGIFEQPELGVNIAVAPQWKVDRFYHAIPAPIRTRWTEEARALVRTGLGMVSTITSALEDVWEELTAGRRVVEEYDFDGTLIPSAAQPPWVLLNAPAFSVVRERVRITAAGALNNRARMTIAAPTVPYLSIFVWSMKAKITLRSTTPDAAGRVGPYMVIRNGARTAAVELVEYPINTGLYYYVFTDGTLTGALTMIDTYLWPVDPFQEHEVEIAIVGDKVILLLVDGQIVDRVAASSFPIAVPTNFNVGSYGPGGAVAVFDIEDVHAEIRCYDVHHRALQRQNAVERLIFLAGCETNDEIQTWTEHHHGVQQLRGTTTGIVMEMRRLAGCSRSEVVSEQRYAGWFLELSWPEVTPIYLELEGWFLDIYVEFAHRAHNFTSQQLADLAARYLVPMSAVELAYHICVTEWMTAPTAVVGGKTRITIPSVEQFDVGDTVTIHDPTNTTIETSTVFQIVTPTTLDVDLLANAYAIGSAIRKELATT